MKAHKSKKFAEYMQQIEIWAEAYDQEAVIMSQNELENLYDNQFFDSMDSIAMQEIKRNESASAQA